MNDLQKSIDTKAKFITYIKEASISELYTLKRQLYKENKSHFSYSYFYRKHDKEGKKLFKQINILKEELRKRKKLTFKTK